jgi:predicted regulator of Ras-like GTPase activity (Roadblock/LC7/MglB family)
LFILIKSSLPREINAKIFGAMSATIFEGIDTAIESLNHEEENKQKETDSLSNITIELNDSQVVIMSVTEDIIIVVALQLEVNLGLILIELEEIIKIVNEILSESAN